jgi:plastocyanin
MRRSLVLTALAVLAACGNGVTSPGAGGPILNVEGRTFGQPPVVAPGETFNITNKDSGRHTLTSATDAWEQVSLPADSTVRFTVPSSLAPGRYPFFCSVHPDSMGGTLVVEG